MDPDFVARAAAIRKADAAKKQAEALERGRLIKEAALKAQEAADMAHAEETARIQRELEAKAEEQFQRRQAEEAQRAEVQRRQKQDEEARERQRQQQAQAEQREREQREEQRRRGHIEAERRAEMQAQQLKEVSALQAEIAKAERAGILTRNRAAAMQQSLPSLSPHERQRMLNDVHQLFDDDLEAQRVRANKERQQQKEEQAKKQREAALKSTVPEIRQNAGPTKLEQLQSARRSSQAQAAQATANLNGDYPVDDIPRALKRPTTRDQALLALQKYVVGVVTHAGMEGLAKHVAAGFEGLPLEAMLQDVAAAYLEAPANVPALVILGLLGFCGSSTLYKAVRQLNVIPDNPNEWIGWLLGCRLYLEYCEWYTMKSGDTSLNDRWRLRGAHGATFPATRAPSGDKKGRIAMRKGAEAKVSQLFEGYPGMPSDALGETMKLFEELADALDAHKLKITDILAKLKASPQNSVAEVQAQAERAREMMEGAREALESARTESGAAQTALQETKEAMSRLKMEAQTKRTAFSSRII